MLPAIPPPQMPFRPGRVARLQLFHRQSHRHAEPEGGIGPADFADAQEHHPAGLPDALQARGHFVRPKLAGMTRPHVTRWMASATSAPGMTPPDSHWHTLAGWTVRPRTAESRVATAFWEMPSAFLHPASVN